MFKLKYLEKSVNCDALVVGLAKGPKGLEIISTLKLDEKEILQSLTDLGATGKADEVIKLPGTATKVILFTGLGKASKEYSSETIRRAAGIAAQNLHGHKSAIFAIENDAKAMAEGAALGSYSFTDFRGHSKKDQKAPLSEIYIDADGDAKLLKEVEIEVKWTFFVRDLVNMPPSFLNPKKFAEIVSAKAKKVSGVKIKVWDEKQLKSQGFGGIIGVGQGSANPPRLVHLSYKPAKAKRTIAYVGKGITFDTGGLALKPALNMDEMKGDMAGAASVVGALLAIAELKLPIAIDAWAPLAENMVSDTATRPSDVITIYGGKTVEVLNPDAEGRLVLADAIVKAQENKNLDAIVDVATLTGAKVVALGTRYSAIMTNNDELCAEFLDVTDVTGEQFWQLPLPEELRASLDTPVADIANIGERMGGALVAGLFLKEFIANELPWLHLDIAGVEINTGKAYGHTPVGASGISVRSLIEMAR
ncbi:MAG: leucyl aminopeptidase [Candidatus Nanopelagicaceae bacterium]|jgi:leucyl aminopeptidase